MAKLFEGKDPFDTPFFTEPLESLFDWRNQFDGQPSSRKQISIEEVNPDGGDAIQAQEGTEQSQQLVAAQKPKKKSINKGAQSFSYRRVAYGGLNGWYYTCSEGRMTGGDGVVLAEIKEEDKTIGESLHTISKGIREKGHSVTTKQSSDGRSDTLQTLHNLKEDELPGFEDDWRVNADKYLPGWNTGFNLLESSGDSRVGWEGGFPSWTGMGGWPFPSLEYPGNAGVIQPFDQSEATNNSEGRSRRAVPIE